jgi:hypothetical protein
MHSWSLEKWIRGRPELVPHIIDGLELAGFRLRRPRWRGWRFKTDRQPALTPDSRTGQLQRVSVDITGTVNQCSLW